MRWYFEMPPSPVSWAKPTGGAPLFMAWTGGPPRAPKLMAEMFSTDEEYGGRALRPRRS